MRKSLHNLSLLALPVLLLLTVALLTTHSGEAQTACCYDNLCNVFQDNGPEDKLCAFLRCSGFSDSCPSSRSSISECERIPSTCEPGSEIDSPLIIDVLGDGFDLTDAAGGVVFDIAGTGRPRRLAWIQGDDAWLALDRDGNGRIDSGEELFGVNTWQPRTEGPPNGFAALAEFDRPENGGNQDGIIDARDSIFTRLRLWQDANHNSVSEPGELHTLPSLDVMRLHLDYKPSKRADEHGNEFRFRAKVDDAKGAKAGRWAWDVFLASGR